MFVLTLSFFTKISFSFLQNLWQHWFILHLKRCWKIKISLKNRILRILVKSSFVIIFLHIYILSLRIMIGSVWSHNLILKQNLLIVHLSSSLNFSLLFLYLSSLLFVSPNSLKLPDFPKLVLIFLIFSIIIIGHICLKLLVWRVN